MAGRVLIVDDDAASRRATARMVRSLGATVVEASDVRAGLAASKDAALILLDLQLSTDIDDRSGFDFLERLAAGRRMPPTIVISGHYTREDVHRALALGASQYLVKSDDGPYKLCPTALKPFIDKFCALRGVPLMIGTSPVMDSLRRRIESLARSDKTVLIRGERGTGKELVARSLHTGSSRTTGPYVVMNAAGLAPHLCESLLFGHVAGAFTGATNNHAGLFEEAQGGTLFLDEIADMPLDQQAKLLRVLESRQVRRVGATAEAHVDVRLVAATNADLEARVRTGHFRADLLDRLAVLDIELPALRSRGRADFDALLDHFLVQQRSNLEISPPAREWLANRPWEGNVRELRHLVEKLAVVADGVVDVPTLEREARGAKPAIAKTSADLYDEAARECERIGLEAFLAGVVQHAVGDAAGNVSAAARRIDAPRKTITRLTRRA